ncbi:MAG: HAD hydrolase family protein [Acutalibacteraceae bacterium]|nr:HAD hydrolase family protein [Acutalibacteraceae bacterium]
MLVFNTDLDNTMIYSYKQNIGSSKRCVEIYQEREISFITNKTFELLKNVKEKLLLVPTTTRTVEQYRRIDFGLGIPKYALACNGGVLLVDGEEDENWYNESYALVENCQQELAKAEEILSNDEFRSFEVRNIKKLFIFTKSSSPKITIEKLKAQLDTNLLDVFYNGVKVYAVPKKLSKGVAIDRFRKMLNATTVITAGDSEFDIPMLQKADIAFAPQKLKECNELNSNTIYIDDKQIFSEGILEYILQNIV